MVSLKGAASRHELALLCRGFAAAALLSFGTSTVLAQAPAAEAASAPLQALPAASATPSPKAQPSAQAASAAKRAPTPTLGAGTALLPPAWQGLSATQKRILAPLERDWDGLDAGRRSKWLEVAQRFPALPAEEQARMQERMRDWTRLSAVERQQARIGFQAAAQQLNSGDRQAKWEAYQALPPEKRQQLADKAAKKQAPKKVGVPTAAAIESQSKSNLVPALTKNLPAKPVAPSLLQAKPGVSTVLITQMALRPSHQQAGQTKVWADPNLVDSKTLLPKRQPAASSPAPGSANPAASAS
ncbi:DUF3106 domain-containing protein [Paucibacter sp. DJ2R-2]|uniref:DUF3106 domain-containing protein n=1 Tax=Paucibacter sp. DJ2R-2 TaxID=2893558 RepID=UPI0021E37632|nr:DUF3106 domain-containing protein [Paucibacter sp. DJ2R-2]MCV2423576.1 DUF3106 domain-containing protein [Paucibacter sp. DJ4R-1]MCV2441421.1 DUF3106 domain-containing protein [Paucibacter sp. DJ2R-2]